MRGLADIIWYERIDSTNDEARRRIDSLDNLSAIVSESQTAGRGQGDHVWSSENGKNVLMSLCLKFDATGMSPLDARDSHLLTEYITHIILRFLETEGIDAGIKLENDIYVDGKKICGILIENVLHGDKVAVSIIGFGLNINQTVFPGNLPNPISLRDLTGKEYDVKQIAISLQKMALEDICLMNSPEGRAKLKTEFYSRVINIQK